MIETFQTVTPREGVPELIVPLRDRWPEAETLGTDEGLKQHLSMLREGLDVINDVVLYPGDNRYALAYLIAATTQPQKNHIYAVGPGGTVKTTLGDLMYGKHRRVTLNSETSQASLFGFRSPIVMNEKYAEVPGGLERGLSGDGDPVLYINELPHLPNLGMFHDFTDADTIKVGGNDVDIRGLSAYSTGNFFIPGERRVNKMDQAFRSRLIGELLTSDITFEASVVLNGLMANRKNNLSEKGEIMPKADVRIGLYNKFYETYTYREPKEGEIDSVGFYISHLIKSVKDSGLVSALSVSDGRIGPSLLNAARANMLLEDLQTGDGTTLRPRDITPSDIAKIAAFVLPAKTPGLDPIRGLGMLREVKEIDETGPQEIEKAVTLRRIIARSAFTKLIELTKANPKIDAEVIATYIDRYPVNVSSYSYANVDAEDLRLDVDEFINKNAEGIKKISKEQAEEINEAKNSNAANKQSSGNSEAEGKGSRRGLLGRNRQS